MSSDSTYRTLQATQTQDSIVKPGELVDVRELSPLTLNDRKVFNLLIQNAGTDIDKPVEHIIEKKALRLGDHNVNDRVGETIERLMAGVATIKVTRDGEPATQRVQLLAANVEHDRADGKFYYTFAPELRVILKDSRMFARLQRDVMLSFTSKYALTLYEMVMKRINLTRKTNELFTIPDFRAVIGVPKGKLSSWSNLYKRAIIPAVEEVNHRGFVHVSVEGVKTGRKYTHVEMKWWRASSDKIDDTVVELNRPALGRQHRMRGTAEPLHVSRLRDYLRGQTIENARKILSPARLDINYILDEWEGIAASKGKPDNLDGSFIGACKKAVKDAEKE